MALLPRALTDPDIGRHLLRDEGEVIVDEVRKHWVCYVVPVLIGLAGVLFLVIFAMSAVRVAWLPLLIAATLRPQAARFGIRSAVQTPNSRGISISRNRTSSYSPAPRKLIDLTSGSEGAGKANGRPD